MVQPCSEGRSYVYRRLFSEIAMTEKQLSKMERLLQATLLMVCCACLSFVSASGQTAETTLRHDASNRREAADLKVEKLIDMGRLQEAREKLRERLFAEGESPRLLLFEAMVLYKENKHIESIRKLERVLSLHDGDPDVYKLIGLNLVAMGREDLTGRFFQKAVELAPRDFMARYYLGLFQLTFKKFDLAEAGFQETVRLNPKYVSGWMMLGVAQEQLGKEAEAVRSYSQAIEIEEKQTSKSEAPFLYLSRLLISMQQFEQCLSPLKQAVAINPKSPEALTLLGRALSRLEKYQEAMAVLEEAVRVAPQDKSPHYLLMGVYQKLGKKDEAQREMRVFSDLEEKEKNK